MTQQAAGLAYRSAGPTDGPLALLLHGYPESSYMWRDLLPVLGEAGRRAIAPDLSGFGDSPADPPGTWERHVESVERLRAELGIERALLVVHDWGGLIGLRWACEHPDAVEALVISCTGFFPDGKWHGLADAMRTPGTGEELVQGMTRDAFAAVLRDSCPGIGDDAVDEYWKCFGDEDRRRGQLELYRSGDFEKIAPYDGRLAGLGVPALILWGEGDRFAPVAGAHRFHKELPGSELVVVDAGHFVFEEAPEESTRAVLDFVRRL
jgi:pimeloyl-ACP methyl ester carboxylesterase